MKIKVLSIEGQETGSSVELSSEIFGIEPNDHAIYLAVKSYQAAQRQGTHKAKERSEITGSRKKIKRQKGTGTARAGDIKNPLFKGGGRVFGPRPRTYTVKLNKKVRELARKSALSHKAKDNSVAVVEDFTFEAPKTSQYVHILNSLNLNDKKITLVLGESDVNIVKSARNVGTTSIATANSLNIHDIMNCETLVFTEGGLNALQEKMKK